MSSSWRYKQITSERDLSQSNFPNGVIKYLFRMGANQQINLNKSFIRLRCKLSDNGGNQLELTDQIAPNYLMAYSLFKQMYHCINGIEVGQVQAYSSQIGALMHRISYPQSYKDKFLATTNYAKIDFQDRINDVIVQGRKEPLIYSPDRYATLTTTESFPNSNIEVAADTITLGINTGVVTFVDQNIVAGSLLDIRNDISVGDYLKIFKQNAHDIRVGIICRVTVVTDALNFTVTPSPTVAGDGPDIFNAGLIRIEKIPNFCEKTRQNQEFEIIFKPPMGIWNKDTWLPAHDMSLKLYPHPDGTYQKNAIQSIGLATKEHGATNDFLFEIEDMIMHLCVKDEKHADGEYDCSYEDIRCQLTNITTTSNVDYHFIVDRQSHSFTMALQDENVENDTRRSSTLFKIRDNQELKLQRYYIQYNGRVLPDPYPQISKTLSKDFFTQRFYESTMYSGANSLYDVESLDDWEKAGPFYTHRFGKGYKQTEKVTVSTLFEADAFGVQSTASFHRPNLLLFDHFTRHFKMVVSQGKVREVKADIVN